ncbi:hypothetical protein RUND412_002479 [Rhizina undulata]
MVSHFVKWYNHKICARQTELEDSGECVAALEAALPRMPHIQVLQPSFNPTRLGLMEKIDEWRGTLTGTHWHHIRNYPIDFCFDCSDDVSMEDGDARIAKHFFDLINVSYRVGLKPKAIGSNYDIFESTLVRFEFFIHSSGILQNCAPLIENLTSLSLYIDSNIFRYCEPINIKNFNKTF